MKITWEIKKLGDVCYSKSSNVSQNQLADDVGKYPIFGASGLIKNVSFYHRDTPYLSIVKDGSGYGRITKMDAFTSVIGTLQYILPNDDIDLDYLNYSLMSVDFKKYIQGAAIPHIYFKDYKNESFLWMPLPEQQHIVAILDDAFAAIAKAKANAQQNLKNAKELFESYLQGMFKNNGDGWETKNLKEVAEYFNGLTYSPKDVSNEGIIVLRSSNVQNDELDFDDIVRVNATVKEKIIVQDGDILMCSRNGSARLVGKTATIKNLNERMTFGTFMMIIRSQYNPYLSWFFKSTDFRNQIKGGENTMINQITRYMLDDVVLSFPPIDKQKEIVQKLNALSLEIKKLDTIYNQKINDLEELKKSVLQKAFNGELKQN
jgi:type I restriction enzyme S subunit